MNQLSAAQAETELRANLKSISEKQNAFNFRGPSIEGLADASGRCFADAVVVGRICASSVELKFLRNASICLAITTTTTNGDI